VKPYCPISFPLLVAGFSDMRYQAKDIMTKDVNKYAKKDTKLHCSCDNWDDLFRCGLYHLSLRGQGMMIDQTQLISL
jgi:hypothetical protein